MIDWPSEMTDQPHQSQTAPATRNLTIIWDDEKQAILERIVELEARMHIMELAITKQDVSSRPASR